MMTNRPAARTAESNHNSGLRVVTVTENIALAIPHYPIPAAALKESVAIIGRTGSGKTYAARGAVELLLRDQARVCIVDPTGVWWGLRSNPAGDAPGFPVAVFGGDHADVPIADTAGAALATTLAARNLPAIVDLSEFTRSGMTRFMNGFLDALYRSNRQPLTLIVDEADLFAPQRPEPETAMTLGRMEQIVRRGRVRGFRTWLITQRPASLNKNVLSQANTLVAMQLTAPQDRDAVGAWIEGQADRNEGKKLLADLPRLKKGEGWVWSPSHDVLHRVRFPTITTYDSGRTPEDGEPVPTVTLAEVDLSSIRQRLRDAGTGAAGNDTQPLRARIAELEASQRLPVPADHEAMEREYERGKEDGRREVLAATSSLPAHLADAISHLRIAGELFAKPHGGDDVAVEMPPQRILGPAQVPEPTKRDHRSLPSRSTSKSADLPRAERMVLTALAQYKRGRTKVQIAVLTGYAVSGGGFNNSLGALRSKGCITGSGENIVITPAGVTVLGPFDPLPHGRALLTHWLGRLGKAERKVLEALADVYPRSLGKGQLASRAGYEATGGGFNNALGRLRTLELIAGSAEIKASADLFA